MFYKQVQNPLQELETYRVFSAVQDFKYASQTFLQVLLRAPWASICCHGASGFPDETDLGVAP